MRGVPAFGLLVLTIAGCSREPRSAAYFDAHPEEAIRVAARCINGDHRGGECETAQAAIAASERKARMDRYQQNF